MSDKNLSWDRQTEIHLDPCPFCGKKPEMKHIGNDYRKKKTIEISCYACVKMRVGAIHHDFKWIEDAIQKQWNSRVQGVIHQNELHTDNIKKEILCQQ
jgi:hypothetical protein